MQKHDVNRMNPMLAKMSVVVLALMAFGTMASHRSADAQDETTVSPIVGLWAFGDPSEPLFSYGIFNPDGTYVENFRSSVGTGIWRAVDEDTIQLYVVSQDINPDPTAFEEGTSTLLKTLNLSDDGNSITGSYDLVVKDTAGTSLLTVTWPILGTRVAFPEPAS